MPTVIHDGYSKGKIFCFDFVCFQSEMGGLGAETLGTVTFLVSVLVSVPVRPKMSGLKKVSVSRDFIQKSQSLSRFHETQMKVSVSVSIS